MGTDRRRERERVREIRPSNPTDDDDDVVIQH